jgi:hypothetical protein
MGSCEATPAPSKWNVDSKEDAVAFGPVLDRELIEEGVRPES